MAQFRSATIKLCVLILIERRTEDHAGSLNQNSTMADEIIYKREATAKNTDIDNQLSHDQADLPEFLGQQ